MKDYKRLTMKSTDTPNCDICLRKDLPCSYEDCHAILYERLQELENKIEQGKLIELPCKVGDTVLVIEEQQIFEMKVCSVSKYGSIHWTKNKPPKIWHYYLESDYTKYYASMYEFSYRWFLIREEAEKKLEEFKNDKEYYISKMQEIIDYCINEYTKDLKKGIYNSAIILYKKIIEPLLTKEEQVFTSDIETFGLNIKSDMTDFFEFLITHIPFVEVIKVNNKISVMRDLANKEYE